MEMIKTLDKAIASREEALNGQVRLLNAISFELKRDNPNIKECLQGLEKIKQFAEYELNEPNVLTLLREAVLKLAN